MSHSKRLEQLEAKTPSAIQPITVMWMSPTDHGQECFAYWKDGLQFHRNDGETEAKFLERAVGGKNAA